MKLFLSSNNNIFIRLIISILPKYILYLIIKILPIIYFVFKLIEYKKFKK